MGVWRFAYTGGPDTPGPDPKAIVPGPRQRRAVQHRQVRRRLLHVGLRRRHAEGHDHRADGVAHLRLRRQQDGDADGELRRRRRGFARPSTRPNVPTPLFTNVDEDVGATVPLVLSLTLGAPATFGAFTPSVDRTTPPRRRRRALATSGDAALTVVRPGDRRPPGAWSTATTRCPPRCRSRPRARWARWLRVRRHRWPRQSDLAAHLPARGQRPGDHAGLQAARRGHGRAAEPAGTARRSRSRSRPRTP